MAHDVFISYCAEDQALANAACAALESAGVPCWMPPRDIPAGMSWGGAKASAIAASRVVVVIVSAGANASPQVLRDVELTVEAGATIIVWRVADVIVADALAGAFGDTEPVRIDGRGEAFQSIPKLIEAVRALPANASPAPGLTQASAPAADVLQGGATQLPPAVPSMVSPGLSPIIRPAPRPVIPLDPATVDGEIVQAYPAPVRPPALPRRMPPPLPATSTGVAAGNTARRRTWSRMRMSASVGCLLLACGAVMTFRALRGGRPAPASAAPQQAAPRRAELPVSVVTPPALKSSAVGGAIAKAPQTQPVTKFVVPELPKVRSVTSRPTTAPVVVVPVAVVPVTPMPAAERRPIDPFADDDAPAERTAMPQNARNSDPERAAALRVAQSLRLQTIMIAGGRRTCIINHRLVGERTAIDGVVVERIEEKAVIVRHGKYRFELTMNE